MLNRPSKLNKVERRGQSGEPPQGDSRHIRHPTSYPPIHLLSITVKVTTLCEVSALEMACRIESDAASCPRLQCACGHYHTQMSHLGEGIFSSWCGWYARRGVGLMRRNRHSGRIAQAAINHIFREIFLLGFGDRSAIKPRPSGKEFIAKEALMLVVRATVSLSWLLRRESSRID